MKFKENVPLQGFNTFRVGGAAKFFVEVKSIEDLSSVFNLPEVSGLPFFILGEGSNVLISDNGFSGLVIKMENKGLEWIEKKDSIEVIAEAGEDWDEFVEKTVEKNLYGLENLSGIPGTVGAAPVQNIGAYGTEIKNVVKWVEVFDTEEKKFKVLSLADCQLTYRNSLFKNTHGSRFIITRVSFILKKEGQLNLSYKDLKNYFQKPPTLKEVREAVLAIRRRKFPDLRQYGTAGSFFKNPIVSKEKLEHILKDFPDLPYFEIGNDEFKIPLAWILENALNVKGKVFDDVEFFRNQPLVVVNLGSAHALKIKEVTDEIILQIKKRFGIEVEREVTLVGKF